MDGLRKVYCEKCNEVFESKEKFDKHFDKHSNSISCEECPLDTAISKLSKLFKRKRSI